MKRKEIEDILSKGILFENILLDFGPVISFRLVVLRIPTVAGRVEGHAK
jgi:hypothetical protein